MSVYSVVGRFAGVLSPTAVTSLRFVTVRSRRSHVVVDTRFGNYALLQPRQWQIMKHCCMTLDCY